MSAETTLNRVIEGKRIADSIKTDYYTDSKCYSIGLFSDDELINFYTIMYLPIFRKLHRITKFILLIPTGENYERFRKIVEENAKFPYVIKECSMWEITCLCCYCLDHRHPGESRRIILNGSVFESENKVWEIVGYNGYSQKDIVALSVLRMSRIPGNEELKEACSYEIPVVKKIDWSKYSDMIPKYDESRPFPDNVEYEVLKLTEKGYIKKQHRIAVFSATKTSAAVIHALKDYNVVAVLDNDPKLWGQELQGIDIKSPDLLCCVENSEEWRIIVPTRSYVMICEQLNNLGFELAKQVFITYQETVPVDYLEDFLNRIKRGNEIYENIRKLYPDEHIYLAPYPGTGDMFLIGMYLHDVMKHDNLNSCILIVPSNGSKKVFDIFNLKSLVKDIIVVNGEKETDALLFYTKITGFDECNISVLNDGYDEIVDLVFARGLRGIDFNTMFQKTVFFASDRRTRAELLHENSDVLFEKHGLRKCRTIVLAPYANTTKGVDEEHWEDIAFKLKEVGYDVCTNVTENELPIKNTIPVFIPYLMLIDFLEKAGGFIALRSGLCDIVSGSNIKKVIFYPPGQSFINSTYYEYFSLEKMGFVTENLHEYVAEEDRMPEIIDEIIDFIGGV